MVKWIRGGRMKINNTMNIRKMNIELVREALLKNNGLTKNEICQATQLSLASCSNILKILMESGEIKKTSICESTGGRRAKRFFINEQYELVLIILVSVIETGFEMDYRVIDASGKNVHRYHIKDESCSDTKIIDQVQILKKSYPNIRAIGISVTGFVENGGIYNAAYYSFNMTHIDQKLEERFHIPVVIENDVNLAVLGFASHIGEEASLGVALIDRGFGVGLYINEQLIRGYSHFAGEILYCVEDGMKKICALNKEQQLTLVAHRCIDIVALLNPYIIGIIGFSQEEIRKIEIEVEKYIPKNHLPKLCFVENKEEEILPGIISLTLSLLKNIE